MPPMERKIALKNLAEVLQALVPDFQQLHTDYMPASWEQVQKAAKNQLFTIGALWKSRYSLYPFKSEVYKDIEGSINTLEDKLGYFSRHFAYPEGQCQHYNEDVITALKSHGILSSPAAFSGLATEFTDLFHLPRNMVDFNFSKTCLEF